MRRSLSIRWVLKHGQLSLRSKLVLSFVCLIVIFMGVGFYNYVQLQQIKTVADEQAKEMNKELMGYQLKQEVESLSVFLAGFLLSKNLNMKEEYEERVQSLKAGINELSEFASSMDERKWKAQLDMTFTEYTEVFHQAEGYIEDSALTPLQITGHMERLYDASQLHKEFIFETIDKFIAKFTEDASLAKAKSEDMLESTASISAMVPLAVLILALGITIILVRSFMKPIDELQRAVDLIAAGDLRHVIGSTRKDELGKLSQSFDRMLLQVRDMLTATQSIASSMSKHSDQFRRFSNETALANSSIVQAIEEISQGTDQQARESETSTSIIGELELEVQDIWNCAEDMLQASRLAEQHTTSGTEAVMSLSNASAQTEDRVNLAMASMQAVASRSAEISKIIHAITDISTQTNILSLNAAIEAARAGSYGKGFSVIAEEVRVLSQQTGESSKNVARIISGLVQQVEDLELQLQEACRLLLEQNAKVDHTLSSFRSIEQSMQNTAQWASHVHTKVKLVRGKTSDLIRSVQEVAGVAQETAAGVEQVNSAVVQQDASIRDVAEQAEDIHSLSVKLFQQIGTFKLDQPE